MKPTQIPESYADDSIGEHVRTVKGPQPHIHDVQALIHAPHGEPEIYSMLVELEPGDLEKLQATGRFWVHFWGSHLHPFAVETLVPE